MAGKNGKYGKKGKSAPKRSNRKSTAPKADRARIEILQEYVVGTTKASLDDNFTAVANKSCCAEMIPVQLTTGLSDNYVRYVQGKYEEYRIAKMEVRVQFKDHDTPVWYLVDRDNSKLVIPKQFKNDRNAGMKMLKENNNGLTLTWRPQKGSPDYDYKPANAIPAEGLDTALGYIKILQHDLPTAVGSQGCHLLVKVTLACRGVIDGSAPANPTAAQTAAINSVIV